MVMTTPWRARLSLPWSTPAQAAALQLHHGFTAATAQAAALHLHSRRVTCLDMSCQCYSLALAVLDPASQLCGVIVIKCAGFLTR